VHAHHHRQSGVDLGEGLEHAAVARLAEALAAVSLRDVKTAEAALPKLTHEVVADPAPLLYLPRVDALGEVAQGRVQCPYPVLLLGLGPREGEDHLLVDLAQEQGLGEGGDAGLGGGLLGGR
jgi:hypothetical protein